MSSELSVHLWLYLRACIRASAYLPLVRRGNPNNSVKSKKVCSSTSPVPKATIFKHLRIKHGYINIKLFSAQRHCIAEERVTHQLPGINKLLVQTDAQDNNNGAGEVCTSTMRWETTLSCPEGAWKMPELQNQHVIKPGWRVKVITRRKTRPSEECSVCLAVIISAKCGGPAVRLLIQTTPSQMWSMGVGASSRCTSENRWHHEEERLSRGGITQDMDMLAIKNKQTKTLFSCNCS